MGAKREILWKCLARWLKWNVSIFKYHSMFPHTLWDRTVHMASLRSSINQWFPDCFSCWMFNRIGGPSFISFPFSFLSFFLFWLLFCLQGYFCFYSYLFPPLVISLLLEENEGPVCRCFKTCKNDTWVNLCNTRWSNDYGSIYHVTVKMTWIFLLHTWVGTCLNLPKLMTEV